MREFVAKTGGRYTYIEDFIGLQDLTLSLISMFEECNNFVVSGCKTSGSSNTNITISEGYVYINGKIRKFNGATVDLSVPYYIIESERTESVSYAQNATQQGCIHYECYGSTELPIEKQYIKLTSTYIPRLKDEFFGKYSATLDSSFAKQTINNKIIFANGLESSKDLIVDSNLTIRNSASGTMLQGHPVSGGAVRFSYNKSDSIASYLSFDENGYIRFSIGNNDKIIVSDVNTAIDALFVNELRNNTLSVKDNYIENISESENTVSININKDGNGTHKSCRDLNIYDGKTNLLFKVDGAMKRTLSKCSINEESADEFGLVLKETIHGYKETLYRKSIAWKDKDGVILGTLGYSDQTSTDMILKNEHGRVIIQGTAIELVGSFNVGGDTISNQYATKQELNEKLKAKVDAVSGMGLSEQNFTSAYKAQLDSMKSGIIAPGDSGVVSGDKVNEALSKKLDKELNLSDVNSKEEARNNLNVYSKTESDSQYLNKKMSNIPELSDEEKTAIRNKIGAGASTLEGEMANIHATIDERIESKKFEEKFAPISISKVKTGSTSGNSSLSIVQQGYMVCIGGTLTLQESGVLFNIPSSFGVPAVTLGGNIVSDISSHETNRGIVWEWQAGANGPSVKASYQVDQHVTTVPFYVTYIAKTPAQ